MPFARATLPRRLAALARFNLLPFCPGHDLAAYERQMRFPRPPSPSLSSENHHWLEQHLGNSAASRECHLNVTLAT
jgi:hypothetical protein